MIERNAAKAAALAALAAARGCTPAQLALAWLLARPQRDEPAGLGGPPLRGVVPIPGSKTAARVAENMGAVAVAARLTPDDLAQIEALDLQVPRPPPPPHPRRRAGGQRAAKSLLAPKSHRRCAGACAAKSCRTVPAGHLQALFRACTARAHGRALQHSLSGLQAHTHTLSFFLALALALSLFLSLSTSCGSRRTHPTAPRPGPRRSSAAAALLPCRTARGPGAISSYMTGPEPDGGCRRRRSWVMGALCKFAGSAWHTGWQ